MGTLPAQKALGALTGPVPGRLGSVLRGMRPRGSRRLHCSLPAAGGRGSPRVPPVATGTTSPVWEVSGEPVADGVLGTWPGWALGRPQPAAEGVQTGRES